MCESLSPFESQKVVTCQLDSARGVYFEASDKDMQKIANLLSPY